MIVNIKPVSENFIVPIYSTPGSSGADLFAIRDDSIKMGEIKMVPLGFAMELPRGYEAQIRPRSSLAKNGIMIPNSPATIDADYRGEVKLILINVLKDPYFINAGDKIAQMMIKETNKVGFEEVNELSETLREAGGFGSTGR